jgi:DNA modification methylase
MTLYYQDDLVTLYHGDCLEVTEWLEGDVLVTDPPYGMKYVSNASKYGSTKPIGGDADAGIRDTVLHLWAEHDPNGEGGELRPALVFGTWRVPRPANTRQIIVWDKGDSPGMGDLALPWGPAHEEVYVIGVGFTGRRRANLYRVPTLPASASYRPDHPTPKPVALMEQLLTYCPGATVSDPFAGSGSTLVAAKGLGRRAIGVELEERYCEVIARRLAQDTLFGGAA